VQAGLPIAGVLLFLEALFGFVAFLGIGFDSFQGVLMILSLILPFPAFLAGLHSLRTATFLLWLLFVVQWVDECFSGVSLRVVNPFDWWQGATFFAPVLIVQVAYLLLRQAGCDNSVSIADAYKPVESA
jgi:hypothetical protein